MTWRAEHQLPTGRDTIDIFGHGFADVVIELDKSRADQVAKKFVSRSAMSVGKIYSVSLCYPGTTHMNVPECIKYFGFCATLSKRIGNVYAGFIVQQTQLGIEDFCVFQ